MATLTLSGPAEEVANLLEDLIDKVRDDSEDEPSISFLPNDGGPAFYIEYDRTGADEMGGVLYQLEGS